MATVTSSGLAVMVEHYNDRRLIETLYPNLPFHPLAEKRPLPKREGEAIKWRQ